MAEQSRFVVFRGDNNTGWYIRLVGGPRLRDSRGYLHFSVERGAREYARDLDRDAATRLHEYTDLAGWLASLGLSLDNGRPRGRTPQPAPWEG